MTTASFDLDTSVNSFFLIYAGDFLGEKLEYEVNFSRKRSGFWRIQTRSVRIVRPKRDHSKANLFPEIWPELDRSTNVDAVIFTERHSKTSHLGNKVGTILGCLRRFASPANLRDFEEEDFANLLDLSILRVRDSNLRLIDLTSF